MSNEMPTRRQAKDAGIRLRYKMDAADLTDGEIRVAIKALRDVILQRQQERATKKYLRSKED